MPVSKRSGAKGFVKDLEALQVDLRKYAKPLLANIADVNSLTDLAID